MADTIQTIKTIFESFDLKGSKTQILDRLNSFEEKTAEYEDDPKSYLVILWIKNIFLQRAGYYSRAEELLDEALNILTKIRDKTFCKWQLKVYLSLGYIHQAQCNYIDADYFLQEALLLSNKNGSQSKFKGEIYSLLARVNLYLNQHTLAKKYVGMEKEASFDKYQTRDKDKVSSIIYIYSLINYCRIKRKIGLVDSTLQPTIEKAISIAE
ncbi:MAG: tetratricopeptide repeat protein, partial [Desulfobacteraceae bacterium]|nr:tetratricopeptide repeat protein [Desulfobacteraceae bacterium]